jgi:hypothetical protein
MMSTKQMHTIVITLRLSTLNTLSALLGLLLSLPHKYSLHNNARHGEISDVVKH